MGEFMSSLWPGFTASIIASVVLGSVVFFWKWSKNLLQPSKVELPTGDWYSYYYKLENNQPVLKTDNWKIKKSALNSSSYHVRIIDPGPGKGWWERFKKRWENAVGFLWKIKAVFVCECPGSGKMVLDGQDACYTVLLNGKGIHPVYIRFLKPTKDSRGNNILRGIALVTYENCFISSGVNILATNNLPPAELMEILRRTSNARNAQRFLRLMPVSLNGS